MDTRDIFIEGKALYLKALTHKDVENSGWYGWFNNQITTENMLKHYFPNTIDNQHRFLDLINNDSKKLQLGIVEKKENALVGVISLNNINFINSNAEFSILIGEKNARGLGYSEEAMFLILRHGFETLNLHKIYGGSFKTLEKWVDFLCEKFGFRIEGIKKEHVYKHGKYLDVIEYAVMRETFFNKCRGYYS